jgi:hypothetical protein
MQVAPFKVASDVSQVGVGVGAVFPVCGSNVVHDVTLFSSVSQVVVVPSTLSVTAVVLPSACTVVVVFGNPLASCVTVTPVPSAFVDVVVVLPFASVTSHVFLAEGAGSVVHVSVDPSGFTPVVEEVVPSLF